VIQLTEDTFGVVFTPAKIGNVEIPNRLVRSATHDCRATNDGFVTDALVKVYDKLARGGAGLTISGMSMVREDGNQTAKMLGNYSDDHLDGLTQLAGTYHDVVKEIGSKSKFFLQIGHAGRQTSPHGYPGEMISSSPTKNPATLKIAKAMTIDEITDIAICFAEAVKRAKVAGFDGVQFHGAHGYLITQFYSPYMNKRTDEYGGTPEKRAKFVVRLLEDCRQKVGNQFPISLKMNGSDRIAGGLEVDEAAHLATIFGEAGFDSLEISAYIWECIIYDSPKSIPPESQRKVRERNMEGYNLELARTIKSELLERVEKKVPLILVGGLYRYETIRTILNETSIEFCSLSRPFISQPNLPNLWQKGPPFPEADCVHCNLCAQDFLHRGGKSKGVRCIWKEKQRKKKKVKSIS